MSAPQRSASLTRRRLMLGAGGLALSGFAGSARAGEATPRRFFRISSGTSGGMYYPLAGLIGAAISNPTQGGKCAVEEVCGVAGLVAVALSSAGSFENLERLVSRRVESAFCQADLAMRCAEGKLPGIPLELGQRLRSIGTLFPEYLHVVTRRSANIRILADLVGKRVSFGGRGSGTDRDAAAFLQSFGMQESSIERVNLSAVQAARAFREGTLDAFFLISGAPANSVTALAQDNLVTLLPMEGVGARHLAERRPPFRSSVIQSGIYPHIPATSTLSVGALWLVTEDLDQELVYEITRALWSQPTADYLIENDRPIGPQVSIENALDDTKTPPLHDGAQRFYREQGMLPA